MAARRTGEWSLDEPESIEWFIEDQGFLPSYDLAPSPPPPPLPSAKQVVSVYQSSCVSPIELTDGSWGGDGGGAKTHDGEKACSLYK